MNINVLFGLMAAVCLVIATAIFGDLLGRVMFGVGYLYCTEGDCLGLLTTRGFLGVLAVLGGVVCAKLIQE